MSTRLVRTGGGAWDGLGVADIAGLDADSFELGLDLQEGFNDFRVEVLSSTGLDLSHGLLVTHGWLVHTPIDQGVIDVHQSHDPASERNGLRLEPDGIAVPVPPLVMGVGQLIGDAQEEVWAKPGPNRAKDLVGNDG